MTAITNIAASGFYDSDDAKSTLLEILLSVDKVESTNLQMAMGKAITAKVLNIQRWITIRPDK